ncbi:MAG TPA: cytochrome c3 family protein [Armatimonadota bacterium]
MLRRNNSLSLITLAVLAACLLATGAVRAGEYHGPLQNTCSDCHTAHASVRGQTWTPTPHLLKNSNGEVSLCMSCHDGTDPQAPDIVASGTASNPTDTVTTLYTSKFGSSAGFFQSDYLTASSPYGHDLAPAFSVSAPLSSGYTKSGGLTCADCHDVHGNDNYRNLLPDPNPAHPGSYSIVIGTQVKETTPVNAQNPNPAVAYDTANVSLYVNNNINAWCTDCHDLLAANSAGSAPAHFRGHPTDVQIGGIGKHTDSANWISPGSGPNTGFGSDVNDSIPGIPRVRYGSPTGSNTIAGSTDTVSCLSCHKAHGSKYKQATVWPLQQAGADMISGCQQCHFK